MYYCIVQYLQYMTLRWVATQGPLGKYAVPRYSYNAHALLMRRPPILGSGPASSASLLLGLHKVRR